MAENLVIVESPAKAKTIEKFLGPGYKVASSFGHISDLPSKNLGIDVEGSFEPKYEVSADKKTIVKNLSDLVKKSKVVWLASDEDREGEAIAWHLYRTLKLNDSNTKRIVFNEITKKAITNAINHPRSIDVNLVDAQQARRVLDRIVGYELSPVLWRKVKGGLSAGRVQSVAVRLLVEKEREIRSHQPRSSFKIDVIFTNNEGKEFKAKLDKEFTDLISAQDFLDNSISSTFSVDEVSKKPAKRYAPAPFTTSTLQQESSRKLSFSVSKTMSVAQRLYEAGYITYMRTDSVNLSSIAIDKAKEFITTQFGNIYSNPKNYSVKSKNAQQAHEAIRPTDFLLNQDLIADYDQKRLYNLILNRTIASQMKEAEIEKTNIKILSSSAREVFSATGEVIKFDGFLKVYSVSKENDIEEGKGILPNLEVKDKIELVKMTATQRFTKPPFRFSEASLVKRLEELGIGRPSTYAPTISTIQNRGYIEKGSNDAKSRDITQITLSGGKIEKNTVNEKYGSNKGKLVPTDIGIIVTDFLVNHFGDIMDYNFTARVEQDFDSIAEGKKEWTSMMKSFYGNFHPVVENVQKNASRESGKRVLGEHPDSKKEVSVRLGKFGPMVQIGTIDDEEKPRFASLSSEFHIESVTLEQALSLFNLPREVGEYNGEKIIANNGRYGPYIKFADKFISIPAGTSPNEIDIEKSIKLVREKLEADKPIHIYEGFDVQKGKGRFGPYIKWNNIFINVPKNYDWENLTSNEIEELIENKKTKEREKIIHNWEDEKISIEKGRWGKFYLVKGKKRILLDKKLDVQSIDIDQAKNIYLASTNKKT